MGSLSVVASSVGNLDGVKVSVSSGSSVKSTRLIGVAVEAINGGDLDLLGGVL